MMFRSKFKYFVLFLIVGLLSIFILSDSIYSQKKKRSKPKAFSADFREKDILDFLKLMSSVIGKNIIADDSVKGKITIISPKRIPQRRALHYLTTVLALKGYAILIEEKFIKVTTIENAIARGSLTHVGLDPIPKEWKTSNLIITAIIELKFAKPSRLSGILKKVTNKATNLVDIDEINTLMITGGAIEIDRLIEIMSHVDKQPIEEIEDLDPTTTDLPGGKVHFYRLKHMEVDKIINTLNKIQLPDDQYTPKNQATSKPNTAQTKVPTKKIEIIAHQESNSLIFVGNTKDWRIIRALIQKIDIARDQVLLEVLIAEVTADKVNNFGIDWSYFDTQNGAYQFNSGTALSNFGAAVAGGSDPTSAAAGTLNTLLGFSIGAFSGGLQGLKAVINANINKENFLVLSAPQILTLDNQEAEINVGSDVPVQTAQRSSSDTVTVNQFDYRSVGVKLKFTPQININQEITLDMFQEVKSIPTTDDSTFLPRIQKRDLKTTIRVKNGQTIVIGGLVSTDKTQTVRKVPILGDIPLLGYLFKRKNTSVTRTNLLIFITPHILSNRTIADRVTEELKELQRKEFIEKND